MKKKLWIIISAVVLLVAIVACLVILKPFNKETADDSSVSTSETIEDGGAVDSDKTQSGNGSSIGAGEIFLPEIEFDDLPEEDKNGSSQGSSSGNVTDSGTSSWPFGDSEIILPEIEFGEDEGDTTVRPIN